MKTIDRAFVRHAIRALVAVLVLAGLAHGTPAYAQAQGERLQQTTPENFRIVGRDSNRVTALVQLVPNDQTGAHWTELLTIQIFQDAKATTPIAFRGELERQWRDNCDQTRVDYAMDGHQNGYPISVWVQSCRYRDARNKPNIALIKMIQGHEQVYVVQVNFRFVPDDAKLKQWTDYLDKVSVCDPRVKGSACSADTR